jgi:hypothetical protein
LIQDIKETSDGKAEIVKGVAKDRIVSVTDPEMRHGRKSAHQRFDGHKATVVADAETGLISDVDILPGNAHDSQNVMEVVERCEEAMGQKVEEVIGDSAYGSGGVRHQLAESGRHVVARVPPLPPTGKFTKRDFKIDEKHDRVTCPAGHVCDDFSVVSSNSGSGRDKQKRKRFTFDAKVCSACPLRSKCVTGIAPRSITLHPQEDLLQSARDFQRTPEFRKEYSLRIVVEHRIARLIQLGMRKARYFGRRKTLFQVLMAAAVANLTLIAGLVAQRGPVAVLFAAVSVLVLITVCFCRHRQDISSTAAA